MNSAPGPRRSKKWLSFRSFWAKEQGFSLLEAVLAMALLALLIPTLMSALSVGLIGIRKSDDRTTAVNLARAQLEYIKSQAYSEAGSYLTLTPPTDWTITLSPAVITTGYLQSNTVTVTGNTETMVVTGYKANR